VLEVAHFLDRRRIDHQPAHLADMFIRTRRCVRRRDLLQGIGRTRYGDIGTHDDALGKGREAVLLFLHCQHP
jgi:hypothetical protein